MSGMAIDAAKKEFNISFSAELKRLRDKYQRIDDSGRRVKPNFFGAKDRGKGYYDCKKRNYLRHDTAMDYLQHEINAYRMNRARKVPLRTFIPFSDIVDATEYDHRNVWKPKVEKIIEQVRDNLNEIKSIYMAAGMSDDEKHELASLRRQDNIESIGEIELTRDAMIYLLKHIEADENKDVSRYIFNTLFGYPNTSFYELIISSREPIPELVENPGGELSIYGVSYSFS